MSLSYFITNLELRPVEGVGMGVFTTRDIAASERVIIFGGHIMTFAEEQALPEFMRDHSLQIAESHVIGSRTKDEVTIADYVNHSCEPNCGFDGQIFLVAMRARSESC